MRITVLTSKPVNICTYECSRYICGDSLLVPPRMDTLIINDTLQINIAAIRAAYTDLDHIVLCDDVRRTTFKSCEGEWRTQRLGFMYYSIRGDAFIGGEAYILSKSRVWITLSVIILLIIICVGLALGIYYAYKDFHR